MGDDLDDELKLKFVTGQLTKAQAMSPFDPCFSALAHMLTVMSSVMKGGPNYPMMGIDLKTFDKATTELGKLESFTVDRDLRDLIFSLCKSYKYSMDHVMKSTRKMMGPKSLYDFNVAAKDRARQSLQLQQNAPGPKFMQLKPQPTFPLHPHQSSAAQNGPSTSNASRMDDTVLEDMSNQVPRSMNDTLISRYDDATAAAAATAA
ncbi:hypothetical protein PFISCL1PPCAC_27872, partial [Pristionchus fissidentatus]